MYRSSTNSKEIEKMNTIRVFPTHISKLEKQFWDFHEKYPEVYRTLRSFSLEWRQRKGADAKLGIAMLFERVRWELAMTFESTKTPRLNNNHKAYYSRLLMERESHLEGLFNLRQQRIQATLGPDNSILPPNTHIS